MVIINRSADYSSCGIGKAPIVTDETKQLLAGFTGLTYDEEMAFQHFIEDIGGVNGTIWSALSHLFIPVFANASLKEAFFDVKGGSTHYPNSVITDENVSSYYDLTDKGVVIKSGASNYANYVFKDANEQVIMQPLSNFLRFVISEPTQSGAKLVWDGGECGTQSSGTFFKMNIRGFGLSGATSATKDAIFFLNSQQSAAYAYLECETATDGAVTTEASETELFTLFGSQANLFSYYRWPVGLKMFGFGDAVNTDNARILATAISRFKSSL